MNTPLISIIIPVYNVEKYLRQCLDSVVAQTYENWECLLIDDGSKDSSGFICDEYASDDHRFRVFHKENGGVSSARNVGLENVKGEWVTFCDSDDSLEYNAFELYLKAFELYNSDIIRAGYKEIYNDGKIKKISIKEAVIINNKNEMLHFMEISKYFGFLWNSFFKKSIINNLRFEDRIFWCEDHLYSLLAYNRCKTICYIPNILYNYYKHSEGSLSFPRDPYMIVNVANLEYAAKLDLVGNDQKLVDETIKLYNNKIGKAMKLAITNMSYTDLQIYYSKTKGDIRHFSKKQKSSIINFFYYSVLPFGIRVIFIKVFYALS